MSFVKWGVEMKPIGTAKAEVTVDGVPISQYLDMVAAQKSAVGLVEKMITCLDEERDAALIQEAHSLLARFKGG